jgi:hypothetical protein
MRATALLIADASPAWRSSTAASTVAVSGATVVVTRRRARECPAARRSSTTLPAGEPNIANPTPAMIGPPSSAERPDALSSAPLRDENRNMTPVIGSSAAPRRQRRVTEALLEVTTTRKVAAPNPP